MQSAIFDSPKDIRLISLILCANSVAPDQCAHQCSLSLELHFLLISQGSFHENLSICELKEIVDPAIADSVATD